MYCFVMMNDKTKKNNFKISINSKGDVIVAVTCV